MKFNIRPAKDIDVVDYLRMRTQDDVDLSSINQRAPRVWLEQRYRTWMDDPRVTMRVATLPKGGVAGWAMIDGSRNVSIMVTKEHRRLGVAKKLLRDILSHPGRYYADVHEDNLGSLRLFYSVGFAEQYRVTRDGQDYIAMMRRV